MMLNSFYPKHSTTTNEHRDRSRSREKPRKERRRSDSSSSENRNKKREYNASRLKSKRVKFNDDMIDIKIFRKEDEPSARGLTDYEILECKASTAAASSQYCDSEELKHQESRREGEAKRRQKEKEKAFNDKLISAKPETDFYYPPLIKKPGSANKGMDSEFERGIDSTEKDAHSARIASTLACYYYKASEIPDEPTMDCILNNKADPEPPKKIAFEAPSEKEHYEISIMAKAKLQQKSRLEKNSKPLKGILKMNNTTQQISPSSSPKTSPNTRFTFVNPNPAKPEGNSSPVATQKPAVDPAFVKVYSQIMANKHLYTKQTIQSLLKPWKDNGTLQVNLKSIIAKENNLPASASSSATPYSSVAPKPLPVNPFQFNVMPRTTQPAPLVPTPVSFFKPTESNPQATRNENYRTVPCKYYHSDLGCHKKYDCNFIHDEAYAGRPTPYTFKNPRAAQPAPAINHSSFGQNSMPTTPQNATSMPYQQPNTPTAANRFGAYPSPHLPQGYPYQPQMGGMVPHMPGQFVNPIMSNAHVNPYMMNPMYNPGYYMMARHS